MSSRPPQRGATATEIPYSQTYWERLSSLVHSADVLKSDGYKLEPLDPEALRRMRRCRNCHLDAVADEEGSVADEPVKEDGVTLTVEEVSSPDEPNEKKKTEEEERKKKKKKYPCRFHPGAVVCKLYTCCANRNPRAPGCTFAEHHVCEDYAPGELEAQWMLHQTPQRKNRTPFPRKAVALDCEMGTSARGESELIRLTAVDYFTGETLVDSLVYPRVPMRHFNTRYSGVTRGMLEAARRSGTCLVGRDAARERLWRFVGPETIVVVHGGHSDFLALRWIHPRAVDTFLVEGVWREKQLKKKKSPEDKGQGGRSLKHLAEVRLGWKIQCGKNGHDSLEDALACRALVDWYVGDLERSSVHG
ncbi:hypothetical protein VTN02DRAFT_1286 [Thermoascus thermophilus]